MFFFNKNQRKCTYLFCVIGDFLLSLFSAASSSTRSYSLLKPLPRSMEKEKAAEVFESFPGVVQLEKSLQSGTLSSSQIDLLHFILNPDMISVRKIAVSKWAKEVGWKSKLGLPDTVFEIDHGVYRDKYANGLARQKHKEFEKAKQSGVPLALGYHGTHLCNVYNILRESLKNDPHLSGRNGQVFGKGECRVCTLFFILKQRYLSFRGSSGCTEFLVFWQILE